MGLSVWQIAIIVVLVLIFFGPKRLPDMGKSIGEAIKGFKKGINDDSIDVTDSANEKIDEKAASATQSEVKKESDKA